MLFSVISGRFYFTRFEKAFKLPHIYKIYRMSDAPVREEYLENDKEIPGQKYVALSFISPENVLANKDIYFFNAFVNDFEVQYKIKATEGFVMKEVRRVTDALSKAEDLLQALAGKVTDKTVEYSDLSGAIAEFKTARQNLSRDSANDLENRCDTTP
jgi:hypothetical protein